MKTHDFTHAKVFSTMKAFNYKLFSLILLLGLSFQFTKAGSGETEYIINSDGDHECTRSLYCNRWAPAGMGCGDVNPEKPFGEDENRDLIQGATFTIPMSDIGSASCFSLNGFFVNKQTALDVKKQPGVRGVVYNERNWNQHDIINTSNFFDEGKIQSVDIPNNEITVKIYTNLPASCVSSSDSTFTYPTNAVFKYEGSTGTPDEVFETGRHVRIYKPRKQIVYAFTPDVFDRPERTPHEYGPTLGWARQGYYKGHVGDPDDGISYFAEERNGEWVNTWALGDIAMRNIDGYRISPEGWGAAVRPGDYLAIHPRAVGSMNNVSYTTVIPMDDGSTIGYIKAIDGNTVTVEVTSTPTGDADDITTQEVDVTLDSDAEYHLNGRMDTTKSAAIKEGIFVRILPNIENGMYCVRDANYDRISLSNPKADPVFLSNDPLERTIDNTVWQQKDTVRVLENTSLELEVFMYTQGETSTQWFKDGKKIPGSDNTTTEGELFLSHKLYTSLDDNGSIFNVEGQAGGKTKTSSPIVLLVSPDTIDLTAEAAFIGDKNTIQLTYNKRVEKGEGTNGSENLSNYDIDKGITINDAILIGDQKTVILKTSDLTAGEEYTITINNVQDIAASPNEIASNTTINASFTVKFRYFDYIFLDSKSSLNSGITEIRYMEDGVKHGKDKSTFGTASDLDNAFDADWSSNASTGDAGDNIGVDLGAGNEITPDSVAIYFRDASGRGTSQFKIMASNNQQDWIELFAKDGSGDTVDMSGYYEFPIDLSGLNPDDILSGAKQPQEITFSEIDDQSYQGSPITLEASSDQGLPISYLVMEGPAEVSGDQLTLTDTGKVWVRAMQPGNETVYSAYPKDQEFNVYKVVTGYKEQSVSSSEITVSPNPFNETIYIYGLEENNVGYKLYDITGKVVKEGRIQTNKIHLSNLKSGFYLLQIKRNTLKILKN